MALLQCGDYLEQFPQWKLVEKDDTALSAQLIRRHHHKHAAAIASSLAAELFGLQLLAPDIQSDPHNYTRFLFVQPRKHIQNTEGNKASIYFQTDHGKY